MIPLNWLPSVHLSTYFHPRTSSREEKESERSEKQKVTPSIRRLRRMMQERRKAHTSIISSFYWKIIMLNCHLPYKMERHFYQWYVFLINCLINYKLISLKKSILLLWKNIIFSYKFQNLKIGFEFKNCKNSEIKFDESKTTLKTFSLYIFIHTHHIY